MILKHEVFDLKSWACCHRITICNDTKEESIESDIAEYDEPAILEFKNETFIGLTEYWDEDAGVFRCKKLFELKTEDQITTYDI